jgi:hypothetical protein
VSEHHRPNRFRGSADSLRRRIEETRAIPGHALQCSECGRLSIGRASGWTMRLADEELYTLCPDCVERELGNTE